MSSTNLFGGNMKVLLPSHSFDISDCRQVPDNQEVFVHKDTDQSIVFEILEYVPEIDQQAARTHFTELAVLNQDSSSDHNEIIDVHPLSRTTLSLCQCSNAYVVKGKQKVSKFKENVKNTIEITMALFRIPDYGSDIVVSFNNPVNINPESSSNNVISTSNTSWKEKDFENIVSSLTLTNPEFLNGPS